MWEALLIPLGSLVAIGAMIGLAMLLRLPDHADLGDVAVAAALNRFDPHAVLDRWIVTADGKSGFGRATDGRLVVARAMGIHPAVRAFRVDGLTVSADHRLAGRTHPEAVARWHFRFGDPGFPDFDIPAPEPLPEWWPAGLVPRPKVTTHAPRAANSIAREENRP